MMELLGIILLLTNMNNSSPPKRQKLENVVEEKETDEAMAS